MSGRIRGPTNILCLALTACVSVVSAGDRRDIVFDCPCSAEWVVGESGGTGSLTLRAGVRSHRATGSGELRLVRLVDRRQQQLLWLSVVWRDSIRCAQRVDGDVRSASGTMRRSEVHLGERIGRDALGSSAWHLHEKLALWAAPQRDGAEAIGSGSASWTC